MKKLLSICATVALLLNLSISAQAFEDNKEFKIKGNVTKGGEKYKLFCVACHGAKGKGDGVAAAALDPKPTDHSDAKYMNTLSDYYLFTIIKEGGPAVGKSAFMAAWKAALPDEDVHNVAAFVRSLSKKKK